MVEDDTTDNHLKRILAQDSCGCSGTSCNAAKSSMPTCALTGERHNSGLQLLAQAEAALRL